MSATRGPWPRLRQMLEAEGFHPSRRLGQNFLIDENLVKAIVREAGVGPGTRVLEVGAGLGFLSLHLLEAGAELLVVEIDRRLFEIARRLVGEGEHGQHARWLRCDALAGKHRLQPELEDALWDEPPWELVANLPYAIACPLMVLLAERDPAPRAMTVLVQREVAERLEARPGSRAWGPLTIRLQLDYDCHIVRRVPPQLFWPRPKVESAVVRLVRRPQAASAEDRAGLRTLVDTLFQRRRQSLVRVLGERVGRQAAQAWIAERGWPQAVRAETLALEQLLELARSPLWRSLEGGGDSTPPHGVSF